MNLKNKLLHLKDTIILKAKEKAYASGFGSTEDYEPKFNSYELSDFVDNLINWYSETMIKGHFTEIGEFHFPEDLRNFIEKMAVWYELRYPDYEINRLMPGSNQEGLYVSDIMFKNNKYINDLLEEEADTKYLDWDEFYNARSFIRALPHTERYFLAKPKFPNLVYIKTGSYPHFHLHPNGTIYEAEGIETLLGYQIYDKELVGKHITELPNLLEEFGYNLSSNSELFKVIKNYKNRVYLKEELLNCVMYRLIDRGGNRIGPRRAFLFAKEFNRSIDIPLIYGIDYSDPGLNSFITTYLEAGGKEDLVCLVGYGSRSRKNEPLSIIKLKEIYKPVTKETEKDPKLTELHQRLVNVLANSIDPEELRQETVKQLRIERKLQKNNLNKKASE